MKRVFLSTMLASFAANSALPQWQKDDENTSFLATGSSCIRVENGNQKAAFVISKYIAQANLVEKQGVVVSSTKRMTTNHDEQGSSESFNQTITTESQGFLPSVQVIEAGIFTDALGAAYGCTWVGIN